MTYRVTDQSFRCRPLESGDPYNAGLRNMGPRVRGDDSNFAWKRNLRNGRAAAVRAGAPAHAGRHRQGIRRPPRRPPRRRGTDLVVNIRRGIVAPPVLIDVNHVAELRTIAADAETIEIGAAVTLAELAAHPQVVRHYPVLAQAAACIAGPTHRNMGTVGGNPASTPAACSITRANGGAPPTTIASRPPATSAMSRPRAAAYALRPIAGSRPGAAHARRRGRPRRAAGQAHPRAERALYRLFAAGSADHRDAGRRQVLSRIAAGRVRRRGAGAQHERLALGLRQDPHPPLDRISRDRRGGGAAARAIRSPTCASPSPAPIRGRCCSRAPRRCAVAGSTRACSRARRAPCATRSCR